MRLVTHSLVWCGIFASIASPPVEAEADPPTKVIARIDLSKPFHLPAGASFVATQGAPMDDPVMPGDQAPGEVQLCVRLRALAPCSPDLDDSLATGRPIDLHSDIHELETVELVYPRGRAAAPLLHLQVGSLHSADNGQLHATDVLAYRTAQHRFVIILHELFGSNHNEEVRYVASGPLRGDIVSAIPTENAPYGYWIAVDRLTPDYRYKQVLRYRSATHYGDGNRLAVIDSEMPNILARLGLWRPGQPLALPKAGCAKPRLVKSELWCS